VRGCGLGPVLALVIERLRGRRRRRVPACASPRGVVSCGRVVGPAGTGGGGAVGGRGDGATHHLRAPVCAAPPLPPRPPLAHRHAPRHDHGLGHDPDDRPGLGLGSLRGGNCSRPRGDPPRLAHLVVGAGLHLRRHARAVRDPGPRPCRRRLHRHERLSRRPLPLQEPAHRHAGLRAGDGHGVR
jgi:hypothetical protein